MLSIENNLPTHNPVSSPMKERVSSFTSSPYQMEVLPFRSDSHNSEAPAPRSGSFEEPVLFHNLATGYSEARACRSVDKPFNNWMLEAPCGSPLSTGSSMSPSEGISTPPYTAQLGPLPTYQTVFEQREPMLEQHLQQCSIGSTSYPIFPGHIESGWPTHYPEGDSWTAQPFVPEWNNTSYEIVPLPPMNSSIPPNCASAAPGLSYPTPDYRPSGEAVDSASFNNEDTKSSEEDSTDESDSDSDDSEYSEQKSYRSANKTRATSGILKLGKWSMALDPYMHPEQRHYECPVQRCNHRFVRPEHLRRHVKTVHSDLKPYGCRIPTCKRAFSRGDNLRDHYWTHVDRGGRTGKNHKMGLVELKAILGPKEKKLVRRLKSKLADTQKKQRAKSQRTSSKL